ncbi:MAG: hypothetical protein K2K93_01505 [Muribaculaceae bacterium]|nr:hypothetical protein [Muribaculaceae bacterium]
MNLKTVIISAGLVACASGASAFNWQPVVTRPNPSQDVTQAWQAESIIFYCNDPAEVTATDVMPVWIDEDGNEIKAVSGQQNPNGWDTHEFSYDFDFSAFRSNGEYILSFPEGVLVTPDGDKSAPVQIPYSFDIPELAAAMFDDFRILSLSPDLNEPQGIWDEQEIRINTNHNDAIGLTMLTVKDLTDNETILISSNFATGRTPGNSSEIAWTIGGVARKFYQEHDYQAEIVFYNGKDQRGENGEMTPVVARAYYNFTGKVEGYRYSQAELLSVTPEPGVFTITKPEEAVFVYTFSQPVTVYKAETPLGSAGITVYPDNCLSSNDDKTVWTLDLSTNPFMLSQDASVIINIYARDLDGSQLRGNSGSETNACYQFGWTCELGAVSLQVTTPPEGETLDELTFVTVKSADGKAMEWSWSGEAYIVNILNERIGTLVYESSSDRAEVEVTFTTWRTPDGVEEPIHLVDEGSYAVVFDHGCFIQGQQYDARVSHSLISQFQISGALAGPGPNPSEQETFLYTESSIADGATVEELSEFYLIFPEEVALAAYYADVVNASDSEPAGKADLELDMEDWNRINVKLQTPLKESGTYKVVIPARTIGTPAFCESDAKQGICNPEIILTFMVDPAQGGTAQIAAESNETIHDISGRHVAAPADKLPKGIYIIGEKKVIVR